MSSLIFFATRSSLHLNNLQTKYIKNSKGKPGEAASANTVYLMSAGCVLCECNFLIFFT